MLLSLTWLLQTLSLPFLLSFLDRLSGQSCSPLDVATATIQGNLNLVSSLPEGTLEQVVVLMDSMTVSLGRDSLLSIGGSNTSLMASMSREWAPVGAEKCLKFLQAVVWVDGETVIHNAATIVRLLIQHPDCLGPSYSGQSLELSRAMKEAFFLLSNQGFKSASRFSSLNRQDTLVSIQQTGPMAGHSASPKRNSSTFSLNVLTAELTTQFYSSLIRLLASCVTHTCHKSTEGGGLPSQTNGKDDHIRSFMHSLVSLEELKEILFLPLAKKEGEGISAVCKESILMFMNNVYDIEQPELLLELLTDAFSPDIRTALEIDKVKFNAYYPLAALFVKRMLEGELKNYPCCEGYLT